ncbi:hypothetical protein VTI74DRAFT_4892 [Chaetomium olivicolor]
MSRFTISRLWGPVSRTVCSTTTTTTTTTTAPQWARLFSQSHASRNSWNHLQQPAPPQGQKSPMNDLVKGVMASSLKPADTSRPLGEDLGVTADPDEQGDEPYHFHIFSHKHNTHITLTKPNRDALISLSCGNLGFRKSNRKHYDSAYQLGAYVIDKMHQKGLVKKIHKMEVVLRGFGPGREAVVKVLMGNEGKLLRPKIMRVSDATRLKFGGTRSKRIRRLG